MYTYPKIETVFTRDNNGNKKLIEGAYRNDTVEFLKDNTWVFTEKVDGTNIGIYWDGYDVIFQGRTEKAQIPNHLFNKLVELFAGNVNEQLFEQQFGNKKAVLFGEGYGVKIQNGGNYIDDVSFMLFDVYLPDQNLWLKRDAIESIAKTFNIEAVPIIMEGTIEDAVNFIKTNPKSTIGKQMATMEGVVGKTKVDVLDRQGNRLMVKIKVKDFV